ncbi:MAG: hypothetical protein EOP55_02130 [Sphingobacteriales bacterium]|nr:MAG: hypothetical protein EOP55_02130 [Sphingobacteriales bacterium]
MNTKYLMVGSSIFLALIGLLFNFAPNEISIYCKIEESEIFQLIIQILGALYLGFAMLNWMARGNLIGGIYSKPVSIGNFAHFLIGALALAKFFLRHHQSTIIIFPLAIYLVFAVAFGLVSFGRQEFK